jgi:hypothetical protein
MQYTQIYIECNLDRSQRSQTGCCETPETYSKHCGFFKWNDLYCLGKIILPGHNRFYFNIWVPHFNQTHQVSWKIKNEDGHTFLQYIIP